MKQYPLHHEDHRLNFRESELQAQVDFYKRRVTELQNEIFSLREELNSLQKEKHENTHPTDTVVPATVP